METLLVLKQLYVLAIVFAVAVGWFSRGEGFRRVARVVIAPVVVLLVISTVAGVWHVAAPLERFGLFLGLSALILLALVAAALRAGTRGGFLTHVLAALVAHAGYDWLRGHRPQAPPLPPVAAPQRFRPGCLAMLALYLGLGLLLAYCS